MFITAVSAKVTLTYLTMGLCREKTALIQSFEQAFNY